MGKARPYTDDEDETIIRMARQGMKTTAMCKVLGRPADGLRYRMRRLRDDGRLTHEEIEQTYEQPTGPRTNLTESAGPIRVAGSLPLSAMQRYAERARRYIAAGMEKSAAINQVYMETGARVVL